MLATVVRRLFQQAPTAPKTQQLERLEPPEVQLEPAPQSPQRPRLLGPRFTEPPSPESASRSRSRSRSPTVGCNSAPSSPSAAGPASFPRGRRSSVATRKRLSFSRSPPVQRRRSFAPRRSVAARSRTSFPHRDFANPEAQTCWLSCLFQALWHSVVFHTAFEQDLAPEKYEPGADEALLAALQQTWIEYKPETQGKADAQEGSTGVVQCAAGQDLVPADGLVDGFGEGYGDMSEALACLQSELSDSTNLAAIALSERMVLLPLAAIDDVLPGPDLAWKQAQEWQVTTAALIAVDITVPELTRESIESLTQLWVPGDWTKENGAKEQPEDPSGNAAQDSKANSELGVGRTEGSLGGTHQLVALVCYMSHLQHYVAFCRRQSNTARCCFFNDLPELTNGVAKEVEWQRVPELCREYSLTPRLVLYESTDAAMDAWSSKCMNAAMEVSTPSKQAREMS